MFNTSNKQEDRSVKEQERILLVLLPFWTPLIPPLGIACIKSFLQQHGYHVRTANANEEESLRGPYNSYFEILKTYIPQDKRGNFYNVGNDVWQNHMMVYLNHVNDMEREKNNKGRNHSVHADDNHNDNAKVNELIKTIIYKTFYTDFDARQIDELNRAIAEFYARLREYWFDLLAEVKPTILGLSVYCGTLPASLFILKLTREEYPHIRTVMGGGIFANHLAVDSPDFDYFCEKTKSYLDKIIIGEGEILFLKLLGGELDDSKRVYTLRDIKERILDLSSVDIPDFSDFDFQKYPHLTAYASRSCPFQCSFCSETLQWGKYRKKKAAQVVDELVKLNKKYGVQVFFMADSLMNPIISDLSNELINADISLYWDGYLRVDQDVGHIENVMLWRRGGFYRARLGVESGSQRVLHLMGKNITTEQIKAAISNLAFSGIKTTTYWVIGYPGETEKDFQQTLDIIEELKDDIYEAECNPFTYYYSGQVKSDEWGFKKNQVTLYPQGARDLLVVRTWVLDCKPSRREIYSRVAKLVEHCNKLGIPNPYSLHDIFLADKRWKKLHRNSVPPIVEFKDSNAIVTENKSVKDLLLAQDVLPDDQDFIF